MYLEKDPLRPLVEVFVCGAHTATIVVTKTKSTQLTPHVGDVRVGVGARVHSGGDCVLFGRKAKAVVTQRVENVETLHALVARVHVGPDVPERVAHMKAGS